MAPYKASSPKGSYQYFFNFCAHAKGCYQEPVCQARMREGKEDIATVTTTGHIETMHWEMLDDHDFQSIEQKGLGRYMDGLKVTYKIGPLHRSTTIMVPCVDDNHPGKGPQPFLHKDKAAGYVVEAPSLHYTIVFPSKKGCKLPTSQLPIGLPGSPTGGSKSSMLGFMLVLGLAVYCCAGAWYKRERLGAQGIEMIPHIDSMCTLVECAKGSCNGDGGVGGMLNKARGVGDDGL